MQGALKPQHSRLSGRRRECCSKQGWRLGALPAWWALLTEGTSSGLSSEGPCHSISQAHVKGWFRHILANSIITCFSSRKETFPLSLFQPPMSSGPGETLGLTLTLSLLSGKPGPLPAPSPFNCKVPQSYLRALLSLLLTGL